MIDKVIAEFYGVWLETLSDEQAEKEYTKLWNISREASINWLASSLDSDQLMRMENDLDSGTLGEWVWEEVPYAKLRIREAINRKLQEVHG